MLGRHNQNSKTRFAGGMSMCLERKPTGDPEENPKMTGIYQPQLPEEYSSLAHALAIRERGDFVPPHVIPCRRARIQYLEEIAADERFKREMKIWDEADMHENDINFLHDVGVRW